MNLLPYLFAQGLDFPKIMFARFVKFKRIAFLHEYVNKTAAFWSAGKSGARFAPPAVVGVKGGDGGGEGNTGG